MGGLIMKALLVIIGSLGFAFADCVWIENIQAKGNDFSKSIEVHNICYKGKHYIGNIGTSIGGSHYINAMSPVYIGNAVKDCTCEEAKKLHKIRPDGSAEEVEIYESK